MFDLMVRSGYCDKPVPIGYHAFAELFNRATSSEFCFATTHIINGRRTWSSQGESIPLDRLHWVYYDQRSFVCRPEFQKLDLISHLGIFKPTTAEELITARSIPLTSKVHQAKRRDERLAGKELKKVQFEMNSHIANLKIHGARPPLSKRKRAQTPFYVAHNPGTQASGSNDQSTPMEITVETPEPPTMPNLPVVRSASAPPETTTLPTIGNEPFAQVAAAGPLDAVPTITVHSVAPLRTSEFDDPTFSFDPDTLDLRDPDQALLFKAYLESVEEETRQEEHEEHVRELMGNPDVIEDGSNDV